MPVLLLVRHAEQDRNENDPGLSELGRPPATELAVRLGSLPIEAVYTSPRRRALETVDILLGDSVRPEVDDRLAERMDWDQARGASWDEFLTDWRRTTTDRDHEPRWGDSSRAAGERFLAASADAVAVHSRGVVLMVSHGGVITDAVRTLFGDAALLRRRPAALATGVGHCSRTVVLWGARRRSLLKFDDH